MPEGDRIRVLVVHGDPICQTGLTAAFSRYSDIHVHDDAELSVQHPRGPQSLKTSIDVIVADFAHGVALAKEVGGHPYPSPVPRIVVVGGHDREWEIRTALECGVHAYLLAGCPLDEVADGVRAAHRGVRHLSTSVAARLADSVSVDPLTDREAEVLGLVVNGLCNKAIGKRLGIAVGTVKSHLKSVFDKLGVRSRTQAVAAVERRGLLSQPPGNNRESLNRSGRPYA